MQFKSIKPATDQSFFSWVYNFSHEEYALSVLINNQEQEWTVEFNSRRNRMRKKICASDCCGLCAVLVNLQQGLVSSLQRNTARINVCVRWGVK